MFNISKSKYVRDDSLFKKLAGEDFWEFRTKYGKLAFRILAFWDKEEPTVVVATHGFIKKTQKLPKNEITKAEVIRKKYYSTK